MVNHSFSENEILFRNANNRGALMRNWILSKFWLKPIFYGMF